MGEIPDFLKPLEKYAETFPFEAVAEAADRREEATPYLIAALQRTVEKADEIAGSEEMLYLYALHLLAEFREVRAYEPAVALARHPLAEELLDDVVTEDLPAILASLSGGDPGPVQSLVEDPAANEYARGSGVRALVGMFDAGMIGREALSEYFGTLLAGKLQREPGNFWNVLAGECADLEMIEHLDRIRKADADGLLDPESEPLDSLKARIRGEDPDDLPRDRIELIDSTISSMSWWACFHTEDDFEPEPDWDPDRFAEFQAETPNAVKPAKVGRNDPCPCGSGKKYKKCCLRGDEEKRLEARTKPDTAIAAAPSPADREVDEPLSEREAALKRVWSRIGGREKLSTAEMDALLEELLALEETEEWCEVMNNFARRGHEDLPRVFRRIAGAVPHTKETALGFFYWAAAEKLLKRGYVDVLPEVGAGVRRLDAESYAFDAVLNVAENLLAADLEGEALKTVEHFYPIAREDHDLLSGAADEMGAWVFLLRIGRAIRQPDTPGREPDDIARDLTIGIEEETSEDYARRAAEIAIGRVPVSEWTRSQFDLLPDSIPEDAAHLEKFSLAVRLARELWTEFGCSPGRSLRGFTYLIDALEGEYESGRGKQPKSPNLLDCLRPKGITNRINLFCGDVFGVNPPRALLLLEAHDSVRRFAGRRGLISETEDKAVKPVLERRIESLRSKYFPPPRGPAGD